MTTPLIFPQSHSSLGTFETCPLQYEAKYVLKLPCMAFQETDATRWGNAVHRLLELWVGCSARGNEGGDIAEIQELCANTTHYSTGLKAEALLPAGDCAIRLMSQRGLHPVIEQSFAIRRDCSATSYWAKDAWQRSKIDLVMLGSTTAIIWDWKTGKPKDDPKQLELYALMIFAAYPELQRIGTGYVWLGDDGRVTPNAPKVYTRADVPALLLAAERRFAPLEQAYQTGMFPAKTSGLCYGWCQNNTCQHWKPKKEKRG